MSTSARRGIRGRHDRSGDAGFTLIELLVVVIVIGILAAIAVPIYGTVARSAHKADAQTWVTNASQLVYQYIVKNGTTPAALSDAGVPNASSDIATQTFLSGTSFCISAYWTGAPSTGVYGPTNDAYKTVYSATRTSVTPVNPASYCVSVNG